MANDVSQDTYWMREALALAEQARLLNEVPVGAIVVRDSRVLGYGFNQPITAQDPSAHAEIVALREAAREEGNYRLPGTTLYVTLEPCAMCAGALVHARVARLVFGAREPKAGMVVSRTHLLAEPWLNHHVEVTGEVLHDECASLVKVFFRDRR